MNHYFPFFFSFLIFLCDCDLISVEVSTFIFLLFKVKGLFVRIPTVNCGKISVPLEESCERVLAVESSPIMFDYSSLIWT